MKKIELKGLEASYYYEKLSNGLRIYLLPLENKKNYFISYATLFGSDVVSFKDENGKVYTPPLGIAHFLEHKMFEEKDGENIFDFYSKSGSDVNASTGREQTQYVCMGNKNFEENLRKLLQMVNSPYFTDENVEKEKGIIKEEIEMYNDMPDYILDTKLRECIYKKSPRRIDIAGTTDSISKITKEDLYTTYDSFYNPNNMFVLIVGNFDKETSLKIIEEECGSLQKRQLPEVIEVKEQKTVARKSLTIKKDVDVPKLEIGIKVSNDDLSLKGMERDLYLHMLSSLHFQSSSKFKESLRKDGLTVSITTEGETSKDYSVFYIEATTTEIDEIEKRIIEEIHKDLDEEAFERTKKVWVANEVKMIDNISATVNNSYDDLIKYGTIVPNRLEIIRNMEFKKLQKLIKEIDLNNISIVKMLSK